MTLILQLRMRWYMSSSSPPQPQYEFGYPFNISNCLLVSWVTPPREQVKLSEPFLLFLQLYLSARKFRWICKLVKRKKRKTEVNVSSKQLKRPKTKLRQSFKKHPVLLFTFSRDRLSNDYLPNMAL